MIRIAICDDMPDVRKELQSKVSQYFRIRREEAEIAVFCTAAEVMVAVGKQPFDIYLLDIALGKNIRGLELGQRLRELYPASAIVFVTGREEYQAEAFDVHAFHYLLKPITTGMINNLFRDYFKSMEDYQKPFLVIRQNRKPVKILLENIIYISKICNRVVYHTDSGEKAEYGSFKKTMEKLDARFMQLHQCYIVNMYRVQRVSRDGCYMDGNHMVSIGRNYAKAFKQRFMELYMEDD